MNALFELEGLFFEWDKSKAEVNLRKHGVTFEEASEVFFSDDFRTLKDLSEVNENRWIAIGSTVSSKILMVVHVYRKSDNDEVIRIISARKLSKGEVKKWSW